MSEQVKVSIIPSGFFVSLLGILFIGLKLAGLIGWSWWWVTAPFWIPWVLSICVVAVILMVIVITAVLKLPK